MYPKVCSSGHQCPTVSSNDGDSLAEKLLAGNPFNPVALPVSIHSVQLVLRYQWCSLAKGHQNSLYILDLPEFMCQRTLAETWREVEWGVGETGSSSHLHASLIDGICELRISRS